VAVLLAAGGLRGQSTVPFDRAVTGRLALGDPQFPDSTRYRVYGFKARAGDTVTALLESDDFDAMLILTDALGNRLSLDDDGGGSCNARLTWTARQAGDYRLHATSSAKLEIGSFRLSLRRGAPAPSDTASCTGFGAVAGVVHVGDTVAGTLTADDPSFDSDSSHFQRWIVPVRARQSFTVELRSDDFDAFLLLARGREDLLENDDGAGDCHARIVYTPPDDRPLRVLVNTAGGGQTGRFVLRVTPGLTPPDPRGTCGRGSGPAAPPETADASDPAPPPIAVGERWTDTLDTRDRVLEDSTLLDVWQITGGAGDTVTIEVFAETFDAVLVVAGPGLERPMFDDDSGGLCNPLLVFRFPASGAFRIGVSASAPRRGGPYILAVTAGAATPVAVPCEMDG
jgi:hypothetical protein